MSELLVSVAFGETRIARREAGRLNGYWMSRGHDLLGSIFWARVEKMLPAMDAAFVDIGQERAGFLPLRGGAKALEGLALAVRVTAEPRGDKGARLALAQGFEDRAKGMKPPALLQAGDDLLGRTLSAMPDIVRVRIDDAAASARRAYPDIAFITEPPGLFEREGLEEEIAALAQPRVDLASGGWLMIEATAALTAIDVNSGGAAREAVRAINLEAAAEAGRQIILRDLGGLIAIDFLEMEKAHQPALLAALADALARDSRKIEVSAAAFGIVLVARQRLGDSLAARMHLACPACTGTGLVPTTETTGLAALRAAAAARRASPGAALTLKANPAVTAWIAGRREDLARLGRLRLEAVPGQKEVFDVAPD